MDERRLNTADVLAAGIIEKPAPVTDIPRDRESVSGNGDDYSGYIGREAVIEALEAGKVVASSNYYGIPHVWKESDGAYRGTLLQYRAITENPSFQTADEAEAWFSETHYRTDG